MSKHHKNTNTSLGDFLGDLDINEVLNLISTLANRIDSKQQIDNDKLLELMKDERFINMISELKKEYKKDDDSNV